jgi:hypothetical protein
VTAIIGNRGDAAPALRATTTLFIREEGKRPRSVDAATPVLLPGTTAEVTFDVVVPAGASIQVMVDSDGSVAESDEGNNRTNSETIGTGAVPRPRGVTIDPALSRHTSTVRIAPLPDGAPRPAAAASFPSGNVVVFVENELLLTTKNVAEAEALAARRGGKIVRRVDRPKATGRGPTFVIRVSTASAPANGITRREDGFAFSSEKARNLLAIAAHERRNGTRVGVNLVIPEAGLFEKKTREGAGNDGLGIDYMQTGGKYDVDVAGAWKALFQAGKTTAKPILIGIVDNGFDIGRPDFTELDLDVAVAVGTGNPIPNGCKGNCPWHGTNVAEAAAGLADDLKGSAGPGAPVARIVAVERGDTFDGTTAAIFRAHDEGARIINMSFMGKVERNAGWFQGAWLDAVENFESDTVWLHNDAGRLLFAAAGNDGEDIDAKNEDGDEAFWHYPCENQGVICVGGWRNDGSSFDGKMPFPGSNFSSGGGEVVDIWGPWCATVGDDFNNPGPQVFDGTKCGTSLATPVVSGVAALIWAANPALSNDQVWDLMSKHAIQDGLKRVHAFRAVREALMSTGINSKPSAIITGKVKITQGSPTELEVSTYDVEDENCCTASWTINGQPAGTGKLFTHSFGEDPLGLKTIAVVITDSDGKTAAASVTGTLSNALPTVKITLAPATNVTQGLITEFRAEITDDEIDLSLPDFSHCPAMTWTSSNDPGVLGTGCRPDITFGSPGTRTVVATYTDKHGAKGSDSKIVNVVGLPPSQMIATIVSPKSDFAFGSKLPIVPAAQVLGASGKVTSSWTLTSHSTGQTKTIFLKDINGSQAFTLDALFPGLELLATQQNYTLALRTTTKSGQIATASVVIGQLPFVK